jgi:hypothetical protein
MATKMKRRSSPFNVSTTSDGVDDAMRLRQSSVERFAIHPQETGRL